MRAEVIQGAIPPSLEVPPGLLALRPRAIWGAVMKQSPAVWAVNLYLFFEYVRPQSIYPAIDFIPWAQVTLLAAVGLAVLELGKRRWTMIDSGIVLFSFTVFLSLTTAFDPKAGMEGLSIFVAWVLVYFAITTTINTQGRVVLMLVGWFVGNFKMALFSFRSWASVGFEFRDWGVVGAPGWFGNSGEFGIQMCVVFPISLYFAFGVRKRVNKLTFLALLSLPFLCVAGTIASSSRGALLGVAAVAAWMFLRSKYKLRGTLGLAAFIALVYVFIPAEQRTRLSNSGDDNTSTSRLTYWKRGIGFANDHPFTGIGYKNWMPYYTYVWGDELGKRERIQVSHNFLVEALSELGYPGLFATLFLLVATFVLNARTRALARRLGDRGTLSENLAWGFDGGLIGFAVSGFFITVLYYPYLWVNLSMTVALHLSVARAVRAAKASARASGSQPAFAAPG